jgi:hypothetical protein
MQGKQTPPASIVNADDTEAAFHEAPQSGDYRQAGLLGR